MIKFLSIHFFCSRFRLFVVFCLFKISMSYFVQIIRKIVQNYDCQYLLSFNVFYNGAQNPNPDSINCWASTRQTQHVSREWQYFSWRRRFGGFSVVKDSCRFLLFIFCPSSSGNLHLYVYYIIYYIV